MLAKAVATEVRYTVYGISCISCTSTHHSLFTPWLLEKCYWFIIKRLIYRILHHITSLINFADSPTASCQPPHPSPHPHPHPHPPPHPHQSPLSLLCTSASIFPFVISCSFSHPLLILTHTGRRNIPYSRRLHDWEQVVRREWEEREGCVHPGQVATCPHLIISTSFSLLLYSILFYAILLCSFVFFYFLLSSLPSYVYSSFL